MIIAGSRSIAPTVAEIDRAIAELDPTGLLWIPQHWQEIVCGMARGADLAGRAWAAAHGIAVHEEPVTAGDFAAHGKLGPKARNHRMAARADGALIFWDGRSSGSADMACRMVERDKPVRVIRWPPLPGKR